ncbi:MAG: helix-turn-helix domain-containing protein [bacterium]
MEIVKVTAQNIKKLRNLKGYSQERLAEITGLHRTYIGSVERGERNLSLINLQKIANALEVDPSELIKKHG